jgi:hypothetical protein
MAVETWENYIARAGHCCLCRRALEENETYHATLLETDQGFERRDYCAACWDDKYRQEAFSFWQAKIPPKQEKRKLFVDNEVLMQIFRRLVAGSAEESGKRPFTFVLALILMRKRLLKYVETEPHEAGEQWVVRVTGEDEELRVVNPHLTEEQLDQVREQLNEVLACD